MPKRAKKGGGGKKKPSANKDVPEYVSDDETLYGKGQDPDPEDRSYFYDDIDEFHANREKILLDKSYQPEDTAVLSDEEGLLDLDSEESDDEEIRTLKAQLRRVKQEQRKYDHADDIEDLSDEEDEEEGLPDDKAWGSRRSKYYGDDDIDLGELEEDNAEAVLEEKEARRLQKQMAEQLGDDDFGLDIFNKPEVSAEKTEKQDKIVKDLSKLSKKEKMQLLKKESPELLILLADFKERMLEVQDKLCPLRQWIEETKVTGKAADFIHTKLKLTLNYCTNIAFYLLLKSKQIPVHNHPVIKRLLQYKNILKQLEPLDNELAEEVEEILTQLNDGKDVVLEPLPEEPKPFIRKQLPKKGSNREEKKRKLKDLVSESESSDEEVTFKDKKLKKSGGDQYETKDEVEALRYYEMLKAGRPEASSDEELQMEGEEKDEQSNEEMDEGLEGKRAINYQIEKNKGLTAHKKKELRNPRVKHRMKFKKAKVRRKGQFREPRTEMQRYGGEISGIRAGIKRGIKLK